MTGTGAAPQPRTRVRRRLSQSIDVYREDIDYSSVIHPDFDVEDFRESLASTADKIVRFISGITDPPQDGLFERIGSKVEFQDLIHYDAPNLAGAWDRLLFCYDVGMNGRKEALIALAVAYNKLHEVKDRVIESERKVWELHNENKVHKRDLGQLQQWDEQLQQSIVKLQDEVEEKGKTVAKLKTEYRNEMKTREEDIKALEEVLADWEELAGDPDEDPDAEYDDNFDHKARVHAVRRKIDEYRVHRDLAESRYRKAQDRCDLLEKKYDELSNRQKSQPSTPGMAVVDTILEAKVTELEIKMIGLEAERDALKAENQNFKKELEVERAHTRQLEAEHVELTVRLADQGEVPPVPRRDSSEDKRQLSELAAYRDKCDILKEKLRTLKKNEQGLKEQVHELKQTVADKTAEAACIERNCQIKVQEAERCIKDLCEKAANAGAGREKPASPVSPPASESASTSASDPAPSPVIPRTTIEEIEEAQLASIQFTQTVMEAIKAIVNSLADKVVMEMAETKELRIEDGENLLEEIHNLGSLVESWAENHENMEENQTLINDQLNSLRETVQDNQNTFREIEQQARSQGSQIEAAKESPFGGNGYGIDDLTSEVVSEIFPLEIYDQLNFGASPLEIDTLKSILAIISQMEAPPVNQELDQAVRVWMRSLYLLQQSLDKGAPYTPTGDQLSQFRRDLREQMARGIENDTTMYYGLVARYKREFDSLLRLDEYVSQPPEWEKKLLEDIRQRIEDAESFADEHIQSRNGLKIDLTELRASMSSSSKQAEILQAVGEFLDGGGSSGPDQTIVIYTNELAAVEPEFTEAAKLVARILNLVVHPAREERRRALRGAIEHQGRLLADLDQYLPKLADRAKDLLERLEAYDRVKDRGFKKETDEQERVDKAFRDGLQRHEYLIRRDYQNIQTRRDRLSEGRAKAQADLKESMAKDLSVAERIVILSLLRIRSSGGSGDHGDPACFCLLLRHFFPKVYYSTISGGCCADSTNATSRRLEAPNVGQPTAPQPQGQSCQGHHGHGVFPSPGALWTSLCHILTFVTWVLLLIPTEPRRVRQTIFFVLSGLSAVPVYLYHLALRTFTRFRRHFLRQLHRPNTSSSKTPPPPLPQPPHLNLPTLPPPSTLLTTALLFFTGFTLLTYAAVEVERRVWLGDNDWRFAYVLDITSGKPLPYPAWSPVLVDYRLAVDPVMEWVARGLHDVVFSWRRGVVVE